MPVLSLNVVSILHRYQATLVSLRDMPIDNQVIHNRLLVLPINYWANPISLLPNLNPWDHLCIIPVSLLAVPSNLQAISSNLQAILISCLAIPSKLQAIPIRVLASPISRPARVSHMWVTPSLQWASNSTKATLTMVSVYYGVRHTIDDNVLYE